MSSEVTDNEAAGRYEIAVDGAVAGYADRHMGDGVMALPHTVVDPSYRGRGLAGQLIEHALADARSRGLTVAPSCSYVSAYIRDHPDQLDLVPERERPRYGL